MEIFVGHYRPLGLHLGDLLLPHPDTTNLTTTKRTNDMTRPIIKEGHRYVRRDGTVTPPMEDKPDTLFLYDSDTERVYGCDEKDGWRVYPASQRDHQFDLMEEYSDE